MFSPGDQVMVVRPTPCCQDPFKLGAVGTVSNNGDIEKSELRLLAEIMHSKVRYEHGPCKTRFYLEEMILVEFGDVDDYFHHSQLKKLPGASEDKTTEVTNDAPTTTEV